MTDNGGGAGGTRRYRIAALTGDGIGPEIMAEAEAALEAAADLGWRGVERHEAGAGRYLEHGAPMDPELPEHLRSFDAILCGPVGDPRVPDTVSTWGTILALRQAFDQYVNLRPSRLLPGVQSPLRDVGPGDFDMVV